MKANKIPNSKHYSIKVYDVIRKHSFHINSEAISKAGSKAMADFQDDYYADPSNRPAKSENQWFKKGNDTPFRYLVLKRDWNEYAKACKINPSELGIHLNGRGYCDHFEKRAYLMVSPKDHAKILNMIGA